MSEINQDLARRALIDPVGLIRMGLESFKQATSKGDAELYLSYKSKEDIKHYNTVRITYHATTRSNGCTGRFYCTEHPGGFIVSSHDEPFSKASFDEIAADIMKAATSTFSDGTYRVDNITCTQTSRECIFDTRGEKLKLDRLCAFGNPLKKELMEAAWRPERHEDWCLDTEEQRNLQLA